MEDEHMEKLKAMEGFNQAFFESYFEVHPDGEYLETDAPVKDAEYLAVSHEWLDTQYEKMKKQKWFHWDPKYGRAEAEDELRKRSIGEFVVRISSQPGHYAISVVRKNKQVDHMLILPSYAGAESNSPGKTQYRIGTYSTDLFNTVPKLIAYYIAHPYYGDERLVGIVTPEEQPGGFYFDVKPVREGESAPAEYLSVE